MNIDRSHCYALQAHCSDICNSYCLQLCNRPTQSINGPKTVIVRAWTIGLSFVQLVTWAVFQTDFRVTLDGCPDISQSYRQL